MLVQMATVRILTIIIRLSIFFLSNVKHLSWCSCVLNIWVSRSIWIAKNLDSRLVSAVHDILFVMVSGQVLWSAIGYFHSMLMLHFANHLMSNHHNITNDIFLLPVLTLTHNWYIYRDIEKDQTEPWDTIYSSFHHAVLQAEIDPFYWKPILALGLRLCVCVCVCMCINH